jgi:ParB family chromosome partitioning protein
MRSPTHPDCSMTDKTPEIRSIPIDSITVLNPRTRNKRIFNELVTSIEHLGLKKPITVSQRKNNGGYDLVCGQGRLEAFVALGQTEIPAVVVDVSKEDCFVMSLVENLARRQHTSLELIREIGALKERGYSYAQIASKTDFSTEYVYAICYLLDHGEERILAAVERGIMPHTIAMEIVRAKDGEVQRALADAYENGSIPGNQVLAIRRIIDQRNLTGKAVHSVNGGRRPGRKVTALTLVRSYRKETERQKLLVKKAALTQGRLVFIVNALRRLMEEENFVTLLRAEGVTSLPKPLVERIERVGA